MRVSEKATGVEKLLIVDDDPAILSQLSLALGDEFEVYTSDTPTKALVIVAKEHPNLITLDLALEMENPESGFSLLEACLERDPLTKIVLITGNDTQDNARRAIEQGAFDFFGKPIDLEALRFMLRRAASIARLERKNQLLLESFGDEDRLGRLLGRSVKIRSVFSMMEKVAPVDVSVLILGESGTGKELVAREIRRLSKRTTKPFVCISCAAIPETLLEGELFGHEKGSFTGAHTSRPGRLELADGGTVFLDEIGELPLALQSKLLRFLQEHEVERIGGRNVIELDVRVIAATNLDLEDEVRAGRFREDLFYRLSVVNLDLPPLRERDEDVLYLANYFLEKFSSEFNRGELSLSRSAGQALQAHTWPGNVRELEHHIQRAVVLSSGKVIQKSDLEIPDFKGRDTLSLRRVRDRTERSTIIEAMQQTCGNISKAAHELEVSRPTLHDLLRKHGIQAAHFKAARQPGRQASGQAPSGEVG